MHVGIRDKRTKLEKHNDSVLCGRNVMKTWAVNMAQGSIFDLRVYSLWLFMADTLKSGFLTISPTASFC